MKKISLLVVLLLFSFPSLTGCGTKTFLGDVKQSGDWIYYVNSEALYKIKTDWSERTKLADEAYRLWVDGETIYYLNDSVLCNLYKINTNGTGNTRLGDDIVSSFAVSGEWIYYCTKKSNAEMNELERKSVPGEIASIIIGALFKMKTDGSEKTKMADLDLSSGLIEVEDNWIYFTNNNGTYKMKTDGTGQSKIADYAGLQAISDNWIYYSYDYTHQYLYRMKTDGTEKTQIVNDSTADFALSGDYIYYTAQGEKGIYRINLDGTEKTKLNDISIKEIKSVYGNWIYYAERFGSGYRINMDGSGKVKFL